MTEMPPTQPHAGMHPKLTGRDPAGRGRVAGSGAGLRGQPRFQLRVAGPPPAVMVASAQAAPAAPTVAAARRGARCQRGLPTPPRVGGGHELVQIRFPRSRPPAVVSPAQAPRPADAGAAGHPARLTAEHRPHRIEDQFLGAEPRPHRGHEPGQQTRGPCGPARSHLRHGLVALTIHAVSSPGRRAWRSARAARCSGRSPPAGTPTRFHRGFAGVRPASTPPPRPRSPPAPGAQWASHVADQGGTNGTDRPGDDRQVPVRVQDGGEFGGGPPLPARPFPLGDPEGGHSATSSPPNQPAAASTRRASSAVRWP